MEPQSDIALMLGSCSNVVSADIPLHLKNISKVIYKAKKHEEFTKLKSTEGAKWLENNCAEAFNLYEEFIKTNYHRGLKEVREINCSSDTIL